MKENDLNYIKAYVAIFFIGLTFSCIERIEPEAFEFDRLVVVDGVFSDEKRLQEVKLSYTSPVEGTSIVRPLAGASVWVEDDLGGIINYRETSLGIYQTADSLQGLAGRGYKLVFITESGQGKRYESQVEELIQSPGIERFYSRFDQRAVGIDGEEESGLQFFVDTKESPSLSSTFYRFEWNDAVQTKAEFLLRSSWRIADRNLELARVVFFRGNRSVEECFELGFSENLIIANSFSNANSSVLEEPIAFVRFDRLNFMRRYSIEVIQYSIGSRAFNYLRQLKEFNESNGSLFEKQQGFVQGNIKSIDNPDEVVLGYFEVAGVSRMRQFYYPIELGSEFASQFTSMSGFCSEDEIIEIEMPDRAFQSDGTLGFTFPLAFVEGVDAYMFNHATELDTMRGWLNNSLFLHPELKCIDCRQHGGIINARPTYWID